LDTFPSREKLYLVPSASSNSILNFFFPDGIYPR
jgi:hypothetical protein